MPDLQVGSGGASSGQPPTGGPVSGTVVQTLIEAIRQGSAATAGSKPPGDAPALPSIFGPLPVPNPDPPSFIEQAGLPPNVLTDRPGASTEAHDDTPGV